MFGLTIFTRKKPWPTASLFVRKTGKDHEISKTDHKSYSNGKKRPSRYDLFNFVLGDSDFPIGYGVFGLVVGTRRSEGTLRILLRQRNRRTANNFFFNKTTNNFVIPSVINPDNVIQIMLTLNSDNVILSLSPELWRLMTFLLISKYRLLVSLL